MRWMNRLATILTILAIVAGPPLLAAAWLQQHPWRIPTRTQLQAWAQQPLTAGTIIAGCLGIAVVMWLLLIAYLTRRAVNELRRRIRRARHLPIPSPAQLTASSMAGVAALTLPALPPGHTPPTPVAADTPHSPEPAGTHPTAPTAATTAGVALPGGGWIPDRTAAAITALAALIWIHRRRTYGPDPARPRSHDTDTDLQPLPPTVNAITAALNSDDTANRDDTTDPAGMPPLPPEGLPHGTLRLTGPGAAAAGRGLLVTAALTAAGDSAEPRIRISGDDLASLLPGMDPALLPATVLSPASEHNGQHPAWHRQDGYDGPQSRPAVSPDPPAPDPGVGTVIQFGDRPVPGHTWHVSAGGTATGTGLTEPRRLCVLDAQTTTDLLTFIGQRPPLTVVARSQPAPQPNHRADPGGEPAGRPAAHLTLFGGCHLTVAGEQVHLHRTAGLQILAYLAVHPDGATRSELTGAVWPQLPAATISQRLHTTLTDLRKQLRPLLGTNPVTLLDDRYRLNTDAITTDLQTWRTTVHTMTHAVDTAARLRACRHLLDTYRGEFAADRTWLWLIPTREQIRRTALDACTTLADHTEPAEALTWIQHAITIDPHNQSLHRHAANLLDAASATETT